MPKPIKSLPNTVTEFLPVEEKIGPKWLQVMMGVVALILVARRRDGRGGASVFSF